MRAGKTDLDRMGGKADLDDPRFIINSAFGRDSGSLDRVRIGV
jgi:hypothetical protein